MITKATVFHPANVHINSGSTWFSGPNLSCQMEADGSLTIGEWETETQTGYAYFAAGQWAYVCVSTGKSEQPK